MTGILIMHEQVTIADFLIFHTVHMFTTHKTPVECGGLDMTHFPHIQAHYDRVANRPNIKSYLASRPKADI